MQFDHRVVKESFDKARPIALDVLTKFFECLFTDHPSVIRVFEKTDLDVLKPKIVKSLVLIMNNLENPDQLRPYLKDLGGRHASYNTKPEHHMWFRDAFLKSLEYFFGEDWTASLALNWSGTFDFIADVMQSGTSQPQIPFPKAIKKDARLEASELSGTFSQISKFGGMGSMNQMPITIGNLIKSADVPDLATMMPSSINLPDELLVRIRETANAIVRKAIETELETALEKELKKYLDKGIAEFLKKSS